MIGWESGRHQTKMLNKFKPSTGELGGIWDLREVPSVESYVEVVWALLCVLGTLTSLACTVLWPQ